MHQFSNIHFRYNPEKTTKLLADRNISFDEIITAILENKVIAVTEHYNQEKYPEQKVAYVAILDKVYVVPYVEEGKNSIFLKTAYPSSKAQDLLISSEK